MSVPAWIPLLRAFRARFRDENDRLILSLHAKISVSGWRLLRSGRTASECTLAELHMERTWTDENEQEEFEKWDEMEGRTYAFLYMRSLPNGSLRFVRLEASRREQGLRIEVTCLREGAEAHIRTVHPEDYVDSNPGRESGIREPQSLDEELESILHGLREEEMPNEGGGLVGGSWRDPALPRPSVDMAPSPPSRVGDADRFPWVPPRFDGVGGGGSQVGPDHPIFDTEREGPSREPPRPGIPCPPGARWDPIQPPGLPGFLPDDLTRPLSGTRRGGPPVHPDMMQPGAEEGGGAPTLPPRSRGPYGQRGPGGDSMPPFL